ncbi:hypothetical protein F4779DRAFT_609684 [Xylariaceae sp. FL0662B]|nr:hypothetical protein F4779DRAFT_609684 [Xylariaceae sp. FL0662B]
MAPVTEFADLCLKPNVDMAFLSEAIKIVIEQPGCLRARSSVVHEDKSKLRLFVDWVSLGAHQDFTKRDVYGPFTELFLSGLTGSVILYHVPFTPFPPTALDNAEGKGKSAVTELLHAYFPSGDGFTADMMASTSRTVQGFLDQLVASAKQSSGETAIGWAVEELEFKGEMCRVLAVAIGWESVDAHMKFRETEDFAKLIPILRGLEGLKGMQVCHVSNTIADPGN